MKTALIPVAANHVDQEVVYPYYRLQEAGFKVEVYCNKPSEWKYGKCCYGKYGVPTPVSIEGAGGLIYNFQEGNKPIPDLILIPGGVESTEVLRQDTFLIKLLHRMMDAKKLVAAYCHGPQVLISAGLTTNRNMVCYPGMAVDLRNSGANVTDDLDIRVVVDDNLVTGRHYNDNPEFLRTVVETYRLREEVIH